MISLLLTLFISLFSVCPAFYKVDQLENINITDVPQAKQVITTSDNTNTWHYYSLNDLTSYDMCNNIWQYSVSQGNYLVNNNVVIGDTINDIYVVDGGDNSHTDYSGFQAFLRVTSYEISYTENSNRWCINLKFNFANMQSTNPRFGLTFQFWRYKFDNILQIQVIPDVSNELTQAFTELLNHPFLIRVIDSPSVPHPNWWLYDVLGNGNFSTYQEAYDIGFSDGYNNGYDSAYQEGYTDGYIQGSSTDATASTIFTGILDVSLIPVNVFLTIFNFEVFGINIAGIVSALLTISVVVIIIRFVTGKKDD